MSGLAIGALGFLFFGVKELSDYDPEILKKVSKNSVFNNGALYYGGGILIIAVATVMQMGRIRNVWYCAAAAIFLLLQLYALFGCFSGKDAYGSVKKQHVYDKGIYALCRHPGFWFFAGMYAFLCLGTELPWYTAALYTALDLLLILIEDVLVFPKTLEGYCDYKRRVAFLIPTPKKIKRTK